MEKLMAVILMGQIRKNHLKDYWSTNPFLQTPVFGKLMSWNWYIQIWSSSQFNDNGLQKESTNRLFKIKPVLDFLLGNFKHYKSQVKNFPQTKQLYLGDVSFKFKPIIQRNLGSMDCLWWFLVKVQLATLEIRSLCGWRQKIRRQFSQFWNPISNSGIMYIKTIIIIVSKLLKPWKKSNSVQYYYRKWKPSCWPKK
jgi:hypothetical protein